jgi:hypothetical protein
MTQSQPPAPRVASSFVSKSTAWFRDERRFWRGCCWLFGIFAVLKGLRLPGAWALTQSQLDYSHGFLKRGLPGTVLHLFGLHHRLPLTVVFFVELVAFLAVLAVLVRRSALERRFGSLVLAAIFAGSYAVTYLTHLVGYTDILNATLAMLLLLVRSAQRRFLLALAVIPVAMLIHESFLFLFLPVVLLSFALDCAAAAPGRARARIAVGAALLLLLALGITLSTSLRPNLSTAQTRQFQAEVAARVDFPLEPGVFALLDHSVAKDVRYMAIAVRVPHWWNQLTVSIACLLPLLLVLLHFQRRMLRERPLPLPGAAQRWVRIAVAAAVFAPLLMHLVAWDAARWNVLCALAAFLVLLVLSRQLPSGAVVLSVAERNCAIVLLALNMATGYGLFDGATVTPYPFYPALVQFLR